MLLRVLSLALVAASVTSCAPRHTTREPKFDVPPESLRANSKPGPTPSPDAPRPDSIYQSGQATWYGAQFAGKKTASGERFDPDSMTAAHRTLAFGTWVEVRRTDTGRSVRVRINDRGPFGDSKRIIDVSRQAAKLLDMTQDGVIAVEIRVVSGPN